MQVQSRVIESLPDILSLNCQLENSKDVEFWKKQEEVYVQSVFCLCICRLPQKEEVCSVCFSLCIHRVPQKEDVSGPVCEAQTGTTYVNRLKRT